ncbi:MAG: PAS domain-containing sensor histidine kinase [Anaerolineae bacterium]|nr:PAS domain-containing sensor histidine kinase [Anaerolineae bacterium]
MTEKEFSSIDYRFRGHDDTYHWVRHNLKLDIIEVDKPIEFIGSWIDITERKHLEEALQDSETKFRAVFDAAHDMILLLDKDANILDVNYQTAALLGYTRAELLQMNTLQHLDLPEDRPFMKKVLDDLMAGQTREYEVRWRTKGGETLYFESASAPRFSAKGEFISTISCLRDITERKHAEEVVWHSQELFSTIFQSVPAAICIVGRDNAHILRINDYMLTLLGYEREEVINGLSTDFWVTQDIRHELVSDIFEKGGIYGLEMPWRTHSGEMVNMLVSSEPIEIDGQPCTLSIAVDLTDRKRNEEAVQRSQNLFLRIFQSVPIAIMITTLREGRILNVNNHALALMGYQADEIIGKLTSEIEAWATPLRERPEVFKALAEEGVAYNIDLKLKTKLGDLRDVIVSLQTIEIEGETCLLTIAIDDTDRKQLEQARLEAEHTRMEVYREREVLELKERFIAKMSHEFRTPLQVILSSKESLEHYSDRMTAELRLEKLHNIEKQVFYATSLLDDVLLLGKAHAGKLQFNAEVMNIATFCQKLFEQIQLTDKITHHYIFSTHGNLGDVQSDAQLLQHILVNLLSNAIKYSSEGGIVQLEMCREGDEAVIRISDQGIGIPVNDQKHLFEPFYRASNTAKIKGTGLGLAIVKESVDTHGGTIACESASGQGTTFVVRLPVQPQNGKTQTES